MFSRATARFWGYTHHFLAWISHARKRFLLKRNGNISEAILCIKESVMSSTFCDLCECLLQLLKPQGARCCFRHSSGASGRSKSTSVRVAMESYVCTAPCHSHLSDGHTGGIVLLPCIIPLLIKYYTWEGGQSPLYLSWRGVCYPEHRHLALDA